MHEEKPLDCFQQLKQTGANSLWNYMFGPLYDINTCFH